MTQAGLKALSAAPPDLPPALPQFAHIRRTWDADLGRPLAKLLPGEYYVTSHDEVIFTVLGSCVSACVRERKLGIGGMNHSGGMSIADRGFDILALLIHNLLYFFLQSILLSAYFRTE